VPGKRPWRRRVPPDWRQVAEAERSGIADALAYVVGNVRELRFLEELEAEAGLAHARAHRCTPASVVEERVGLGQRPEAAKHEDAMRVALGAIHGSFGDTRRLL